MIFADNAPEMKCYKSYLRVPRLQKSAWRTGDAGLRSSCEVCATCAPKPRDSQLRRRKRKRKQFEFPSLQKANKSKMRTALYKAHRGLEMNAEARVMPLPDPRVDKGDRRPALLRAPPRMVLCVVVTFGLEQRASKSL